MLGSTEVTRSTATDRWNAQRSPAATQAIVYVSPFSHPTNQYSSNLRRNLCWAGFDVRSPDDIWKGKAWFQRKPKYVFLSWFEDRILKPGTGSRIVNALIFAYKLTAILLQRVQIIWVRHNHRAHGQDVPDWLANRVLQVLQWASVATVVHSEQLADEQNWNYLPHPLYEISEAQPSAEFVASLPKLDQRIAVLGQIRPSKGLDVMLHHWPRSRPLILAGKPVTPGYDAILQRIIDDRNLDVKAIYRNLNPDEFDWILGNCQAIYISNPDATMVVSGVFFHAASLGTPVILNRSAFAHEASQSCRFAFVVDSTEELSTVLNGCDLPHRCNIVAQANELYGQGAFEKQLWKLFSRIECRSH